jgi:hypothetical protein
MEPTNNEIPTETGRATQIDSGATPLSTSNIPLGLSAPDILANYHGNATVKDWTYSELLSQHKLVGTFQITPKTDPLSPIWSFNHTMKNVFDLHFREMKKLFRLYSWTLNFSFEFHSNFQQVGQVLVVNHNIPKNCIPYLLGSAYNLETSYRVQTMLPHVKVPMGEDCLVHCCLQWKAPVEAAINTKYTYTYSDSKGLSDASDYDMGTVYLIAPIPMQIVERVDPAMTVRIWSYLTNLKMAAYDPVDDLL